jgi:hypothetical protein
MGAETYVLDRNIDRLRELDSHLDCSTIFSTTLAIEELLPQADLVIGAVLVHGAKAPHVITREQLGLMKRNAVLVDVAIDQGGCFETSRPTTHSDPTYKVDRVTHYCVANMPGAVPITSTAALTNATIPYVVKLATEGVYRALDTDPGFMAGLNVVAGRVTYEPVARQWSTHRPRTRFAFRQPPPRACEPIHNAPCRTDAGVRSGSSQALATDDEEQCTWVAGHSCSVCLSGRELPPGAPRRIGWRQSATRGSPWPTPRTNACN